MILLRIAHIRIISLALGSLFVSVCWSANAQSGSSTRPIGTSRITSSFIVNLTNNLGIKATVDVTAFTAGKDTWGDREHDFITQELNFMGGQWPMQENGTSQLPVDFSNGRLVIELTGAETGPRQYLLIPWQSFKSVSVEDGIQVIQLNDGSVY